MTPAEMVAKRKREAIAESGTVKRKVCGRQPVVFDCTVKSLMDDLGLTYRDVQLACRINPQTLSAIRLGMGLSLTTAMKVAKFFGKPIEEIWSLKEEKRGK